MPSIRFSGVIAGSGGPSLRRPQQDPQAQNGLLAHRQIPEAAHRLAVQQQPKTEIEIVGDGVFVEAPRRINRLVQQQLTIAPQLADAAMGPALWRDPVLLEIPARTSGKSRPEEVQLYEQF